MKILIIEDMLRIQEAWKMHLEKHDHTVVQALTPHEAIDLFEENPDVDIIVLDGCIGPLFNCLPVLREIRETFKGPIIAASSDAHFRQTMVQAGCSHECEKEQVLSLIKAISEGRIAA